MTTFRLRLIVDEKTRDRIHILLDALELAKKDYEVVDGLTLAWDIEYRNFENLEWEIYYGNSIGISREYIARENKIVKTLFGEKYASVAYVVDMENWKAPGIGGWNLGRFYSGMSAQIMEVYRTTYSTNQVITMELAHCLNEQVYKELGIKLKDELGVSDWDFQVIHGKHPDYNSFNYQPVFRKIADVLLRTFQKREQRFLNELKVKVNLLTKILGLYRTLFILLKSKPIAIHEEELKAE